MILSNVANEKMIIYIALGAIGLIIIGIVFFVLDKFVFMKRRCAKTLKEITKTFEYYNALLTGQDSSYIKRLEVISRTNLLYNDIHASYYKRAKEIRDNYATACQDFIVELGSRLEENKIKDFKNLLKEKQGLINQFKEIVEQLNNDLLNVIKPEEEARQGIFALKEQFRELKSKYHMKESELTFVDSSFEDVFIKIDERFQQFDMLIDNANYDEANEILPIVNNTIQNLFKLIDDLPPIINDLKQVIPEKINELIQRYKKITNEGKPLRHLAVESRINQLNSKLEICQKKVINLNIDVISNYVANIFETINQINSEFDLEEQSYSEFIENKEKIISNFLAIENNFIELTNNLPRFQKFYIIDEEHNENLSKIKNSLDNVTRNKRTLDQCMHGYDYYPFSELLKQLKNLEKGTQEVSSQLDAFTSI